jgi:hypothetical protein
MSEELELATLYSDDHLLDCLAGRTEVSDPDLVSDLLAAFAAEDDTFPVRRADATLLSVGSHPAFVPAPAAPVHAADAPAAEPGPPASVPPAVPAARTRRLHVLPRTAATAGVMAVVLGIGGAAAAVGGNSGPLQHLRRAVISVTDQVAPGSSREDRVADLLNDAHVALRTGNLRLASEKAGKARQQLSGLTGSVAEALQDELATVLERIRSASQRIGAAAANAGIPGGSTIVGHPSAGGHSGAADDAEAAGSPAATKAASTKGTRTAGAASPSATPSHPGLGDRLANTGVTDTTDQLPKGMPGEPGIGDAKEKLKDKANEQLAGVPEVEDPVAPIAPWRHPASEGVFDNPMYSRVIGGLGGDALAPSEPRAVADGLTGGAVSPR